MRTHETGLPLPAGNGASNPHNTAVSKVSVSNFDKRQQRDALAEKGLKHCAHCQTDKPFAAFGSHKGRFLDLADYCKLCNAGLQRQRFGWHAKAPKTVQESPKPSKPLTPQPEIKQVVKSIQTPTKPIVNLSDRVAQLEKKVSALIQQVEWVNQAINNLMDRLHRLEKTK